MNGGEPWRTLADDAPANFKTGGLRALRSSNSMGSFQIGGTFGGTGC
jgi:hypothetical protein